MKLTNRLSQYKAQLLTVLSSNDLYLSTLILMAVLIWFFGPYFAWHDSLPLVDINKRLYVILFLCLIWLLKFLLFDATPDSLHSQNMPLKKKLHELENRFSGAWHFMKKTTIFQHGKKARLHTLPCYLLLGPPHAGKTTLLSHADIHFILKRQPKPLAHEPSLKTKHCDWWITHQASIIDVPGHYLSGKVASASLWRFFLSLLKKHVGKKGIDGILLAIPLPEILKQHHAKPSQLMINDFLKYLAEINHTFSQRIPCKLVITKCDLLPGFNEFFADASKEEINQAWGINLPELTNHHQHADLFIQRFNALIKKLNQQLLARIHQERNPMLKLQIKNFPLQIEQLKELILHFIKKFSASQSTLSLQGVFLVSALQPKIDEIDIFAEPSIPNEQSIQLFKTPPQSSRSYFTKQLLTQGLIPATSTSTETNTHHVFRRHAITTASIVIITITTFILGQNLWQGIKNIQTLQYTITQAQLALAKESEPHQQLIITLHLLHALQQSATEEKFNLSLANLAKFYTHQSKQKAEALYNKVLQSILLPVIRNHFANYLATPINEESENVYAALKAYLMLGDQTHTQAIFIINTLNKTMPKFDSDINMQELISHVDRALQSDWRPLPLDQLLINKTRNYFVTMRSEQLGFIILKNINNNNTTTHLSLFNGQDAKNTFSHQHINQRIPTMFTAKTFATILAKEITQASEETLLGNWVLGTVNPLDNKPELALTLISELRMSYIKHYVSTWENLLDNVELSTPSDLTELDLMLESLISNRSPFLQLLQTLHDNTYFEPIISASPKLERLGTLIERKNQSTNQLYQIFASLQSLHQYIETVLAGDNRGKSAFELVSKRMQKHTGLDPITQLRLVAQQNPEPIKQWLDKIANHAWRLLMRDASHYIDTSYRTNVSPIYQLEIAGRYPFSAHATAEVGIAEFIKFFGKTGVVFNFYHDFLYPFVDTSTPEWHWKTVDNLTLPYKEDILRQIQQAMLVHHTFFPHDDNQLLVQFTLQPYQFSHEVKQVKLTFNREQFTDLSQQQNAQANLAHFIAWPGNAKIHQTSIQLILANQQMIRQQFNGPWGLFKLINQSFENVLSKKKMLLNLSKNDQAAKYILSANNEFNPFLSMNLHHFQLPDQLIQG